MRTSAPLAIAFCILLAGCTESAGPGTSATNPDSEARNAGVLSFNECWDGAGRFAIPYAEAQAELPPGFTAVRGGQFGDEAVLFITGFECEVADASGETTSVRDLQTMILVDPPEEHETLGNDFRSHGYLVDWATSSPVTSAFYEEWGAPHAMDDVIATVTIDTPTLRVGHAESTMAGGMTLETVAGGPAEPFGAGTVRAFYLVDAADGQHLHRVDVTWSGIPNAALGGGTLNHGHYGQLQSTDMFHAWTYAWDMEFKDLGLL